MLAPSATVTLQLDQLSAQQLERFVSRLNEELRSDRDLSTLSCTEDQLSDAIWIARWLREYVTLELDAGQAVDLLQALVVRLDEETWSDADVDLLTAIVNQLCVGLQHTLAWTDQLAGKMSVARQPERGLATT